MTSGMEGWSITGGGCKHVNRCAFRCDNLERQSAALLQAPEIHSKEMLYVASSKLHLLTLLLVFFPLRNCARGLRSFLPMMSAPCK